MASYQYVSDLTDSTWAQIYGNEQSEILFVLLPSTRNMSYLSDNET